MGEDSTKEQWHLPALLSPEWAALSPVPPVLPLKLVNSAPRCLSLVPFELLPQCRRSEWAWEKVSLWASPWAGPFRENTCGSRCPLPPAQREAKQRAPASMSVVQAALWTKSSAEILIRVSRNKSYWFISPCFALPPSSLSLAFPSSCLWALRMGQPPRLLTPGPHLVLSVGNGLCLSTPPTLDSCQQHSESPCAAAPSRPVMVSSVCTELVGCDW